ncbi:MAG TPA: HEAT repeat domain-containing protein [Longilinea sp.]|nr:HEAT repeat domain-containing protein [Longilinea sp.]
MNTLTPDQIRAYTTILRADPDYQMRKKAAFALVKSNDPMSIDVLTNFALLSTDEALQKIALEALGEIMGEEDLQAYLETYRKEIELDVEDEELNELDDPEGCPLRPVSQTSTNGPENVGCLPFAVLIVILILLLI